MTTQEGSKPAFRKVPSDWSQMTDEEKHAWSLSFVKAIKDARDGQEATET